MNYFKALGIIFGLIAMLKPIYMHVIPWNENKLISRVYSKKRHPFLIVIAVLGILLVILTWIQHFRLDIKYSLILTILFSITSLKAIVLIADYKKFQKWVADMLNKENGKKIKIIDLFVGVFGFILLILSCILY